MMDHRGDLQVVYDVVYTTLTFEVCDVSEGTIYRRVRSDVAWGPYRCAAAANLQSIAQRDSVSRRKTAAKSAARGGGKMRIDERTSNVKCSNSLDARDWDQ